MCIKESKECFLCKRRITTDKYEVDWFTLPKVDYDADLWQYSGMGCHYDCYKKWEYKKEYEKESKQFKEHIEELNKRVENANESERRQIYEEEVRQWNEKVKRKHLEIEDIPKHENSDDDPWKIQWTPPDKNGPDT